MVITLYPVLIDSNCSFASQYWNPGVLFPLLPGHSYLFHSRETVWSLGMPPSLQKGLRSPSFSGQWGKLQNRVLFKKHLESGLMWGQRSPGLVDPECWTAQADSIPHCVRSYDTVKTGIDTGIYRLIQASSLYATNGLTYVS